MGKKPIENRVSKINTPKLKLIKRNNSEAVQEMLWEIALNGQTRKPLGDRKPHNFFNCSEKE
jgi:hypothetical protein